MKEKVKDVTDDNNVKDEMNDMNVNNANNVRNENTANNVRNEKKKKSYETNLSCRPCDTSRDGTLPWQDNEAVAVA